MLGWRSDGSQLLKPTPSASIFTHVPCPLGWKIQLYYLKFKIFMCDVLEVPLCLGRCPCDSSALAPPAVSVCPAPPIVTSWRPHALVEVWNKSNFIHIYVWSFNVLLIKIDQADRLKKKTNKQTQKQAKNKQASLQPTVKSSSLY